MVIGTFQISLSTQSPRQILPNLLSQQTPPTLTDEADSTLHKELEMTSLQAT